MKSNALWIVALLFAAGCNQTQLENDSNNSLLTRNESTPVPSPAPPAAHPRSPAPAPAPEPGTSGGLPDDRTPLPEPNGPIDPKSAEAAGQVVQHYGALIEQKRFADAEKLWGDAAVAAKTTAELKDDSELHLQIGKPTDMEGAAGSIYITVPIVLYGKLSSGAPLHRRGDAILRRVNDVPGSTEAQRRWHIERIDWKDAA
jgi:hypothetical protein